MGRQNSVEEQWAKINIECIPTSLKQLEDEFKEEWNKIPLGTVQNMYESIPGRMTSVLKAKGGPTPY
jgi:hypothetical protein